MEVKFCVHCETCSLCIYVYMYPFCIYRVSKLYWTSPVGRTWGFLKFPTDLLCICRGMNEHIFLLYIILHLHFFHVFYESSLWQSFAGQSLQTADDLICHFVFISIELISSYAVYANSLNLLTKWYSRF